MRIGCPDLLSNISGGPETHRTSVYSRTQLKRRLIASGIKQDCLAHVELCRLRLTSTHPT